MSDVVRIVISEAFGGFGLSAAAKSRMKELGWSAARDYDGEIERDDPRLVRVVEELGTARASGGYASLKVVDIPADVKWHIHEYDGAETIHENHRSWDSGGEEQNCL